MNKRRFWVGALGFGLVTLGIGLVMALPITDGELVLAGVGLALVSLGTQIAFMAAVGGRPPQEKP